MGSRLDPRWIPVAIMLVVVPILASVLISNACLDNSGGSGGTPRPIGSRTPTPITATGTIAFITTDGNVALMDPNGTNKRVLTNDGSARSLAWSPGGSMLAVQRGDGAAAGVRVIRPDGSFVFEIERAAEPLWSPAGGNLAVVQGRDVAVVDTTSAPVRLFTDATRPTWSPGGDRLAFVKLNADGTGVPVVGELQSGAEFPLSPDIKASAPDYLIAWHPAGEVIAYRDHLYEPATGTTRGLPGTASGWSPDGRMLLVTGEFNPTDNGTPGLLLDTTKDFKNTIGLLIRPSAEDIPPWLFINKWTAWSPDGRRLVYLDPEPQTEKARIYDTVALTQDINRGIAGAEPSISPDGSHVTFTYQDKVWVMPVDVTTLVSTAEGRSPVWQPASQTQ